MTRTGRYLPRLVKFSDGATSQTKFYAQGVDYFDSLTYVDFTLKLDRLKTV